MALAVSPDVLVFVALFLAGKSLLQAALHGGPFLFRREQFVTDGPHDFGARIASQAFDAGVRVKNPALAVRDDDAFAEALDEGTIKLLALLQAPAQVLGLREQSSRITGVGYCGLLAA